MKVAKAESSPSEGQVMNAFFCWGEVGQSPGSWWLMYVDVGSANSMRSIITQGYALK